MTTRKKDARFLTEMGKRYNIAIPKEQGMHQAPPVYFAIINLQGKTYIHFKPRELYLNQMKNE
jgi:hypothetical protein